MDTLGRLEGHEDIINQACILKGEDGVLSISDDKTIRIWLKRERGSYWPSVCHLLPSQVVCFYFDQDAKRLFVGLANGIISEFTVNEDFNRIEHKRYFSSHQSRVTGLVFSPNYNWLMSVGRDKQFHWDDSETSTKITSYTLQFPCTAIQFDIQSRHVFISETNGQITMLKLENNTCRHITTMHGHQEAIRSLLWEPVHKWLFSAGADKLVICWDIGGRKGAAYELNGHHSRVTSLCYRSEDRTLFSGGEDCKIVAWNMNAHREETHSWSNSDCCQRCERPFFWNFKTMYETRTFGLRQHHCRRCGKAVCCGCSQRRSTIPLMGFEREVRVCDDCFPLFNDANRKPMAQFFEMQQHINHMDFNEQKGIILTTGYDRKMVILKCPPLNSIAPQ